MNIDNVIAALAYCINEVGCPECPYYCNNEGCFTKLMKDALETIKNQKEIIEKYKTADNFLYVHGWRWDKKEEVNNEEDVLRSEWY